MKEADPRCLLSQPPENFASEGCERQGARLRGDIRGAQPPGPCVADLSGELRGRSCEARRKGYATRRRQLSEGARTLRI